MADKKEDTKGKQNKADGDDDDDTSTGGKVAVFFVTLLIIIIWIAIMILLIKWDVGGFGSKVMYPILKDVPYLNQVLPEVKAEEDQSLYPYTTIAEANAYVNDLKAELATKQMEIDDKKAEINELTSKINKLSVYEANEKEYERLKKKFDEEVVFSDSAPDISNYQEYYEAISPENAEKIYKQVLEQQLTDSELRDYVATYSSMKAKNAAAIFDTMTDKLGLVAQILEAMDTQSRANILGAMEAENAAKLTSIMNPK